MKQDSRLSGILHILLHLMEREGPVTSEDLAGMLATNPVVVRRIMAGLRQQGYVRSEKGHGGGWSPGRDLSNVTLRDIYLTLGRQSLFAIGNRTESPQCLVEQAVNATLEKAFHDAEERLLESFGNVTLSMLSADVHSRIIARGCYPPKEGHSHAS